MASRGDSEKMETPYTDLGKEELVGDKEIQSTNANVTAQSPPQSEPIHLLNFFQNYSWHSEMLRMGEIHMGKKQARNNHRSKRRKFEEMCVVHENAIASERQVASQYKQKFCSTWPNQETDLRSDDYTELQSYGDVVSDFCRCPFSKEYWDKIHNVITELIQSLGTHWGLSTEKIKGRRRPKLDRIFSDQLAYLHDPQISNRTRNGIKAFRPLECAKKIMKAYLECVLRVPRFLMSSDSRQLMSHTGLSLSEHPLGRLITVFVLIFRSIFHGAVKHAILVIARDNRDSSATWGHEYHDGLSDAMNTLECMIEEPLSVWLNRCICLVSKFVVCVKDQMLRYWPFCKRNKDLENLLEETVLSTILKHLPEVQIFHRACMVRSDRALEERLMSISNGSSSLLEAMEVPVSLQLAETIDIITGLGDEELEAQQDTCLKNYSEVVKMLLSVQKLHCPIDKARAMAAAIRAVNTSALHYNEASDVSAPPSFVAADDLLSVLPFIMTMICGPKSKRVNVSAPSTPLLRHPHSHVEFSITWLPPHLQKGQLGYCLTIMSSVLTLLRRDGVSERNINRVEEAKAAVSSMADELQARDATDIDMSSSNESTPAKCTMKQTFDFMLPNPSKRDNSGRRSL